MGGFIKQILGKSKYNTFGHPPIRTSLSPKSSTSKQKQHKSYAMSTTIDYFVCVWCMVGGGGEGVGELVKCITPLSIAEFFNSSKLLQPEKIFTEFFDFE